MISAKQKTLCAKNEEVKNYLFPNAADNGTIT